MSNDRAPTLSVLILRVYLPFALAYFFSYFYRTVNAVISPDLTSELNLSGADLGLLTAAYYVSFSASQLPIGVMLDRFGPRRVHAGLLAIAAVGAVLFGLAQSMGTLFLARALIGMGVAAGLMAALKAISLWFPPDRWAMINGFHLAFGGLGAMVATAPVEWALGITDWRGVFFILAGLTLLVSLSVFLAVPEKPAAQASGGMKQALQGVAQVFKSAWFWRIAPAAIMSQASFMSIQTLWAGPWFRDVAGFNRAISSNYLLAVAGAMTVGFMTSGLISNALAKRGVSPFATMCGGYACFMAVQALIVLGAVPHLLGTWMIFGFFGATGVLCFPILTKAFPLQLGGRVTTSCNMIMFGMTFAIQFGLGAILDIWGKNAGGAYPAQAYAIAFAVPLALQLATFSWLVLARRAPAAAN